jgi:hypothetical protein
MMDLQLHFDGPFTFTDGATSIFSCRWSQSAGIYLWTIRQQGDDSHLVHYVGETAQLGRRHREHLIHVLGLNYGIFAPDEARKGVCKILWKGLWRERLVEATPQVLLEYQRLHEIVLRYIDAITIFFAELTVGSQLRKHIEGCIGSNLRTKHADCKQLYPDDNHVGTMAERWHGQLLVTAAEVIRGLDASIAY